MCLSESGILEIETVSKMLSTFLKSPKVVYLPILPSAQLLSHHCTQENLTLPFKMQSC